jgi:hypothetical protein
MAGQHLLVVVRQRRPGNEPKDRGTQSATAALHRLRSPTDILLSDATVPGPNPLKTSVSRKSKEINRRKIACLFFQCRPEA